MSKIIPCRLDPLKTVRSGDHAQPAPADGKPHRTILMPAGRYAGRSPWAFFRRAFSIKKPLIAGVSPRKRMVNRVRVRGGPAAFPGKHLICAGPCLTCRGICLPNGHRCVANGGTGNFVRSNGRIGANGAWHREHLMVPARQLTSQAQTLRANGGFPFSLRCGVRRHSVAIRVGDERALNGNRHTSAT